jgi:catechol 2,3-dioxygenase-like lactoylglutathione lyase family enzyme
VTTAYRPSHVGVCVSDLTASLRFWCDGLGFERLHAFELDDTAVPGLAEALEVAPPVAVTSQLIRLGELTVELIGWTSPAPTGTPSTSRGSLGLTHLSFTVDDVDALATHLVAHGGRLLPETRQDVGVQVVFLADPDGTRVELMQG